MTGSLQVKKNIYYAVLNVPDEFGKTRPKWISTGIRTDVGKKREAQKALRVLLAQYEDGHTIYSHKIMFTDWIQKWIEQEHYQVDQITWEAYKLYADKHIIPFFAKRKLALTNVTPQHVQDYYTEKLKNGRIDGKGGLSPNSIKKHSVVIKGALQEAVIKNIIPFNPADRATLPKLEPFVGKYYTVEQANHLLEVIKEDPLEPVVILTLFYGLRRSEVLGLKWDAVDFKNKTIQIKRTVVTMTSTVEKERTKNKKSNRTLPLISNVEEYLLNLQKEQSQNRLLFGAQYVTNDCICKWSNGKPFSPNYVTTHFELVLRRNNMPPIRFHDLRHTTASMLISKSFSLKEIQEWLGHNDISTTANIYGHLDFKDKINIAENMGNIIKVGFEGQS